MVMSLMSLRVRYSRLYQAGAKTLMSFLPRAVVTAFAATTTRRMRTSILKDIPVNLACHFYCTSIFHQASAPYRDIKIPRSLM
jgi:hypothetical protein